MILSFHSSKSSEAFHYTQEEIQIPTKISKSCLSWCPPPCPSAKSTFTCSPAGNTPPQGCEQTVKGHLEWSQEFSPFLPLGLRHQLNANFRKKTLLRLTTTYRKEVPLCSYSWPQSRLLCLQFHYTLQLFYSLVWLLFSTCRSL